MGPTSSPSGAPHASTDPAWHGDPFARHEQRWWDGAKWTEKVSDSGVRSIDPPGIDPAPTAATREEPAQPIVDAHLPIKPPAAAPQLTFLLGIFVFVILAVLIVLVILGVV